MTNKIVAHNQKAKFVRLNINGRTLEYYDENEIGMINYSAISETDARELFCTVKKLFDEAGLKFALCFGSLLGAVREKGHVIPGDEDMDIFICNEKHLRDKLIWLQENGLNICRILPGILYSFRINYSCYIDVYIMNEIHEFPLLPWHFYCISLAGNETNRKFFKKYTEIEFLGEKCLCPENPEKLLEFWYGKNWRIPVRGHKFIYRVKSAHYYHEYVEKKLYYTFKAFKFIFNSKYRQKILQRKRETGSFFAG